jgi:hypothetical protein
VRERSFAVKQFIDEHSEGPNVSLRPIDVLNESFGRHVDGGADIDVFEFILGEFGETEVCEFGLPVMDENISYLEVSVHDMIIGQVEESLEGILDVPFGLEFLEGAFGPELAF